MAAENKDSSTANIQATTAGGSRFWTAGVSRLALMGVLAASAWTTPAPASADLDTTPALDTSALVGSVSYGVEAVTQQISRTPLGRALLQFAQEAEIKVVYSDAVRASNTAGQYTHHNKTIEMLPGEPMELQVMTLAQNLREAWQATHLGKPEILAIASPQQGWVFNRLAEADARAFALNFMAERAEMLGIEPRAMAGVSSNMARGIARLQNEYRSADGLTPDEYRVLALEPFVRAQGHLNDYHLAWAAWQHERAVGMIETAESAMAGQYLHRATAAAQAAVDHFSATPDNAAIEQLIRGLGGTDMNPQSPTALQGAHITTDYLVNTLAMAQADAPLPDRPGTTYAAAMMAYEHAFDQYRETAQSLLSRLDGKADTPTTGITFLREEMARTPMGRDLLAFADENDVDIAFDESLRGTRTNGIYNFGSNSIGLRPDRPLEAQMQTLSHELRHAWQNSHFEHGHLLENASPGQHWVINAYTETDAFSFSAYFMADRAEKLDISPLTLHRLPDSCGERIAQIRQELGSADGLTMDEYRHIALEPYLGYITHYHQDFMSWAQAREQQAETLVQNVKTAMENGDTAEAQAQAEIARSRFLKTPGAEAMEGLVRGLGGLDLNPATSRYLMETLAAKPAGMAGAGLSASQYAEAIKTLDDSFHLHQHTATQLSQTLQEQQSPAATPEPARPQAPPRVKAPGMP